MHASVGMHAHAHAMPSLRHIRTRANTSSAHRRASGKTVENFIVVLHWQWRLRYREGRIFGAILWNEGHPSHAVARCAAERDEATPDPLVPTRRVHEHFRASLEPANLLRLESMI